MDNIVIATDLQPETENALLRALQLSEEHSAKLYILHVASCMLENINETTSIEDWSKDIIQALIKKYPAHKKVVYEISIVRGGRIQDQIDKFSRERDADLVIMGADRSTINAPEVVRTKVEHVLWQGDYPVLAVFYRYKTAI